MADKFWRKARKAQERCGSPPVYPFFGQTNQWPCSNHAAVNFLWKGEVATSSEAVYLPAKAEHFRFFTFARELRAIRNPKIQKRRMSTNRELNRIAKDPKHSLSRSWATKKEGLMRRIVAAKFRGNAAARSALLQTGDKYLVEASPFDRYWGSGIAATDPAVQEGPENPRFGMNRMGQILMQLRQSYQNQAENLARHSASRSS